MSGASSIAAAQTTGRTWAMIVLGMVIGFTLESRAHGAGDNAGGSEPAHRAESTGKTADHSAHMDKPMAGKMKKKGMMQGDVNKAAGGWDQKMKEIMEKEEKITSQSGTAK
jgi:hypothetical protein